MFRVRLTFHLPKAPSTVPTGVSGRRRRGDPGSALMVSDGHRSPWEMVDGSPRRRDAGDAAGQCSAGLPAAHSGRGTQALLLPGAHGARPAARSAARTGGASRRGSKALGMASPRGSAAGDPQGCLLLPMPRGRAELEKGPGNSPTLRAQPAVGTTVTSGCFHPTTPNPGKESRLAEKNKGFRARSYAWLCHSLSPNIWSRILLSRETNLASGEQLARRLN